MRAAGLAVKRGYSAVYTFIGGIPEWRTFNYPMFNDTAYQNIEVTKLSPQEFQVLASKTQMYVLDVRPLDFERDSSFLPKAFHCPLVHLAASFPQIPPDHTILITDWAMKQSPMAAKFLISKGYTVAGVLQGGVERWKSELLPVETREPRQTIDLKPPST